MKCVVPTPHHSLAGIHLKGEINNTYGNHPVCYVSILRHLHGAQNGQIYVTAEKRNNTNLVSYFFEVFHNSITGSVGMSHPRIIAKLSCELKNEAPGITVTVSFPAFIRSGSIVFSVGNGPKPNIPFSD